MWRFKINGGSLITFVGWFISTMLMPFMGDIIRKVIIGMDIDIHAPVDFKVQTMYWGIFLLIVWIPVGIKASEIYEGKGIKKSFIFIALTFFIVLFIISLIVRIFIN